MKVDVVKVFDRLPKKAQEHLVEFREVFVDDYKELTAHNNEVTRGTLQMDAFLIRGYCHALEDVGLITLEEKQALRAWLLERGGLV